MSDEQGITLVKEVNFANLPVTPLKDKGATAKVSHILDLPDLLEDDAPKSPFGKKGVVVV